MTAKQSVKSALSKTPLFDLVYKSYLFTMRNDYWNKYIILRNFYKNFVKPGDLVFDIGANRGMHARCFLDLGARVIAIDPVQSNVEALRQIHSPRLTVLACAVAGKVGTAYMSVSTQNTDFSTLSKDWLGKAKQSERFNHVTWDQHIEVPTTTIDSLIAEYGVPNFIKIDVEGFESAVLDGMTKLPCPLSFEWSGETPEQTKACINKPCIPKNAEFNFTSDNLNAIVLAKWVTKDELPAMLYGSAGDILVRPRP